MINGFDTPPSGIHKYDQLVQDLRNISNGGLLLYGNWEEVFVLGLVFNQADAPENFDKEDYLDSFLGRGIVKDDVRDAWVLRLESLDVFGYLVTHYCFLRVFDRISREILGDKQRHLQRIQPQSQSLSLIPEDHDHFIQNIALIRALLQ